MNDHAHERAHELKQEHVHRHDAGERNPQQQTHQQQQNHSAEGGPTVLDIGDDIGALVLYTSAELVGAEIEISPDVDPHHRRHVAVHPRHYPGGTAYAAVYYGLAAGTYELWAADGSVALTVSIEGNTVTESVWPEWAPAPR